MKKTYNLLILIVALMVSFIDAFAQQPPVIINPYPVNAQEISRGYGQGLLTVRVAFPGACSNDTVIVRFPESVTYVPGTITKTASLPTGMSISEADISNLNKPKFVVNGVTPASDITFTLARKAGCGSEFNGKDTVIVKGSCGTAIEEDGNTNSYNIIAPALTISQPTALTGALVGTKRTRRLSINNGGFGVADTVNFYIVYPNGGMGNSTLNNSIVANGVSFNPVRVNGDTLFYAFFGSTFFKGDGVLENGESVDIEEPIEVLKCNGTTNYAAGWGVNQNEICDWAETTGSISMAGGVPTLSSLTYSNTNYVNRCTPYDVNFSALNGGTGNDTAAAFFNVNIEHGYVYPGRSTVESYDGAIMTYANGRINGNSVSTFNVTNGRAYMDLTDLFPTSGPDPDGPGGLADLDGDGFYDDLPRGESLSYTMQLTWNCNTPCGKDKIHYSGGRIYYSDMCGNPKATEPKYSYRPVYESSFTGISYLPANIFGGDTFTIELKEGHYINSFVGDNANTRYEWKLVLPTGFVAVGNATYGGASTTYNQIGDTIYIISTTNSLQNASIDLKLNCGTGGGKTFNYSLTKINDITTNCRCQGNIMCATVNTTAFCPGPCPAGPTNQIPVVRRTDGSLGWTDNTLATRQTADNISAFDLSKALYLDTIQITGSAIQNNAATSLHLELSLGKAGSIKKLAPIDIRVSIYRLGALVASGNTAVFVDNSTSSTQIVDWNVSSFLPVGGMLPGDSILTVSKYLVATNQGLPQNDIQAGQRFIHYNLVGGVKEYCFNPVPEMYLVGTSLVDGRNGFYTSGCNITTLGGSGSNLARRFNTSGELYKNEFRPVFYIDSVVMVKPKGYDLISLTNNIGGGTLTPNYQIQDTFTYINPGTWRAVGLTVTNNYGAGFPYSFQPTCKTEATATHGIKFYIKDYYYANSTKPTYPSQYQYILNNSSGNIASRNTFREQTVSYSSENKPILVMQNLSGTVVGAKPQEHWDIEVRNDGLAIAPNLWVALEKTSGSGILIDSVVLLSSGTKLTRSNYGSGNSWYKVSDVGVASGTSETVRVFFKYGKCTQDSILVKTGWNCGSYPSPNPGADANACSVGQVYAAVTPNTSQVQFLISRQPGNGSPINLCEFDSVVAVINSAQSAYLVNPSVDIFTPASGVTLSNPMKVEYPRGSGNIEMITAVAIPGGYRLNLNQHSGIGTTGIPGTLTNPTTPGRQAKIVVEFTTSCSHSSGSPLDFRVFGYKPCGTPAIGNNKIVKSDGIHIAGGAPAGKMGIDIQLNNDSFNCGVVKVLDLTVTPIIDPSADGDTVEYILPEGLTYNGNFTPGINCTGCSATEIPGTTNNTIVKVALEGGIAAGTPMEFTFEIGTTSSGNCGNSEIAVQAKRQIPALTCNGSVCPSSNAVIGSSSAPIRILRPILTIPELTGKFLNFEPDHTYDFNAIVKNDITGSAVPVGNITQLKVYLDDNKNKLFDEGSDILLSTHTYNYGFLPGQSQNLYGKFQYAAEPDSTKAIFVVLDASSSPNCNCAVEAISPMVTGLPVDLLSFNAVLIDGVTELTWTTASEINNDKFIVERRLDGEKGFKPIGEVKGAGNSNQVLNYYYTDYLSGVNGGNIFYRLKQVDFNGEFKYSEVKFVSLSNVGKEIIVYPNPAKNEVNVRVPQVSGNFNYSFVNALGQTLMSGTGNNQNPIDINSLPKGVYFLNLSYNNEILDNISIVIE